jgi:RecA-dependent nuclease
MNKLEQLRVDRMMQLGCVCCAWLDLPYIAQECHHIVEGNRRLGHWFTLPLCRGHHQGDWTFEQKLVIPPAKLVAVCSGSKAFEAAYPSQRELWEMVQARLHLSWPVSKVIPRRVA